MACSIQNKWEITDRTTHPSYPIMKSLKDLANHCRLWNTQVFKKELPKPKHIEQQIDSIDNKEESNDISHKLIYKYVWLSKLFCNKFHYLKREDGDKFVKSSGLIMETKTLLIYDTTENVLSCSA